MERWAAKGIHITEKIIQMLHALVMADGKLKVKPTPYRTGQNVIRDRYTKGIVYMPPQAKDLPNLMQSMVQWIKENYGLPSPILAGIVHYQFATIHPYYDGNGRTARLLSTLILPLSGYSQRPVFIRRILCP